MKLREVEWHKKTKHISQVSSDGLEFAFLTKDYHQIHQLVWCKDFMQDAIWAFLNQKKVSIYGFAYDPKCDLPIHLNSTRLLLTNRRDRDFSRKIKNSLIFMNKIEKDLKMAKTIIQKCKEPPRLYRKSGAFIFDGSKRWMKSPPMISLYTLLIRVGLVHDPKLSWKKTVEKIRNGELAPYYSYDSNFLKNGKIGIDRIFEFGDRRIFHRNIKDNYPSDVKSTRIHNGFGIIGFSRDETSVSCPHWHRLIGEKT